MSEKTSTQEIRENASKILYSMELLEYQWIPDGISKTFVTRVPGGWIFHNYNESQATFVPFNNEFKEPLRLK